MNVPCATDRFRVDADGDGSAFSVVLVAKVVGFDVGSGRLCAALDEEGV